MSRPRVVVIGGGFAGFFAAKELQTHADQFEIVLINPTDYFTYLPMLPEIAAGALQAQRICVSLRRWGDRVTLRLGTVDAIDVDAGTVSVRGAEGRAETLSYDRLLITVGSVNKLLPIPGVAENAHGLRGIAEALYLRDHMTRQIELAAETTDPAERAARCTFVVVGGGYTGTETTAQGQLFTERLARSIPQLAGQRIRWVLLDLAPRLMPELDKRMSKTAERVLGQRGVEVKVGTSVASAEPGAVTLTDGETVPTRSLIWCVGVRADPVVSELGLPVDRGRLVVDAQLQVPDHPHVFACGDCAAAPDLTRSGQVCGMTAQHAMRQGRRAALNIAASLGAGESKAYKHHDLGFLVDLGGTQAAANPLGIPLSGVLAKLVTRGYHLEALPGNRFRTAVDWAMNAIRPPTAVHLGLVHPEDVSLVAELPVAPPAPSAS